MYLYQHTRSQFIRLISSRDTATIFELCNLSDHTHLDTTHPNAFHLTFNYNEFVSACKKSGFFIILF